MKKDAGCGFWFLWVGVNAVGWFMGGYLFYIFIAMLGAAAPFYPDDYAFVYGIIAVAGMICGSIPGILQWIILRIYLTGVSGWWFLTCAVGIILFICAIFWGWNVGLSFAVMGILQWLILRRSASETVWWVIATIIVAILASGISMNELNQPIFMPLLFIGNSAIMGVTLLGLWPK